MTNGGIKGGMMDERNADRPDGARKYSLGVEEDFPLGPVSILGLKV